MTVPSRRAMTPQDITRIRFISDPQLSPDGRRVAFVVTTLSEDQDEYLSNIWVVDTAGGGTRRFTTGPQRDTAPRWSPDGSRLAFVSERVPKQKAQLYVMPADGGEPARLTELRNGAAHPVWSPDSTRLAFVSRVGGWQERRTRQNARSPNRRHYLAEVQVQQRGFYLRPTPAYFCGVSRRGPPQQPTDGDCVDGTRPGHRMAAPLPLLQRGMETATTITLLMCGHPSRWRRAAVPDGYRRSREPPVFSPTGVLLPSRGHRYRHDAGRNMRVFTVPVA